MIIMPIDDPNIEESDAFIIDDLGGLAPHDLHHASIIAHQFPADIYSVPLYGPLHCRIVAPESR
jgi:hypothetical protein